MALQFDPTKMWNAWEYVNLKPYFYLFFGLLLTYLIVSSIYTVYFHPLSKFPGPKRAAVSNASICGFCH